MKHKIEVAFITLLSIGLFLTGCGKDDAAATATTNPNAVASAAGFAVGNVVASTGSSSASFLGHTKTVFWSAMNVSGLSFILNYFGLVENKRSHAADSTFTGCTDATGKLADACADPDAVVAEMTTIATASTLTTAQTELANFTESTGYRASCYGPGWTDNATGGSTNRPTGDTGIIATDLTSTDTTACAAGQLTALLAGYPAFANDVLTLQATLVSALKIAGKSLPAVGESVDAKADMPTISGFTLTTATINRYADTADGYKVYYTNFAGTDANSKAFSAQIYHVPEDADNSAYKGVLKALFPHTATMGGTGTYTGLSMVYNKASDGTLAYELRTSANRSVNSSDFFGTNGVVDYTKSSFGEDGNVIRATFNPSTNVGTMHYAWQAGGTDAASRSFAIHVPAGTEGALTGTAYFGFANPMHGNLLTALASPGGSSIWASAMRCNWVNDMSTSVSKIQKQTFTQNATTGKFENSGTAKIAYTPTSTCVGGSYTVTNSSPSTYNGTRAAVSASDANYLTTYTSGDVPAVTVTYPFASGVLPAS